MKRIVFFIFLIGISMTLLSQIKANVKMLNGDTIPCGIATERLDLVTDYGELSFGTKFIKSIQFPEPGKGNTILNTIFGETFRGFITNDIIELNVYGSLMQIRKAKINNIKFLNENQQATDYTIVISLRNGDTFYATPVDSIINIQTSYGEVKLPFENMAAISFEGFGNVLTRIEMKDEGIIQGIIKDDYIPVNLLSEIELEVVPDLMKEIKFINVDKITDVNDVGKKESNQILLNSIVENLLTQTKTELVLVKSGTFKKEHTIKLTYDYYIGKYEVTFDEYDTFCEETGKTKPSDVGWGRAERPVINVSWYDAIAYCNWLSEKEGLSKAYDKEGNLLTDTGKKTTDITEVEGYRLPTEAEWEYAARGGHKSTEDYEYSGSYQINAVAWYYGNSDFKTSDVGQKQPNELGLYDMSGNVWEWCQDYWDENNNSKSQTENPLNNLRSSSRVRRGGSWFNDDKLCRVDTSDGFNPNGTYFYHGFRIAKTQH